ncbi:MAG: hypothetical protein JJ896_15935 [Rhodothermales bacterium]|nr:hypothetical protein [Rhodothermales bacterium]MBO6781145.1 hypothetical protein [Rhodothermales bacterium]
MRVLSVFLLLAMSGCRQGAPPPGIPAAPTSADFGAYWYQGQAELTSYRLEQPRYGEVREGEAVLIYVTEALSRARQVKLDNPSGAGSDRVDVMKLNMTKNFVTGIYPYSMMMSVFTPLEGASDAKTLKVTTTSQEWCGHTFTQMNLEEDAYRIRHYSYFEKEGDTDQRLEPALLEDEIWTKLRIDPDALPTGDIRVIPGTMYQRLSHIDFQVLPATASLVSDGAESAYRLDYAERSLSIRFETAFPHAVLGWEESWRGQTTRAERLRDITIDYWTRNSVVDEALRDSLGLR